MISIMNTEYIDSSVHNETDSELNSYKKNHKHNFYYRNLYRATYSIAWLIKFPQTTSNYEKGETKVFLEYFFWENSNVAAWAAVIYFLIQM